MNNNRHMPQLFAQLLLLAGLSGLSLTSFAQSVPDAGQVLQQQRSLAPQPPRESPVLTIQAPASDLTLPGGQAVTLESVNFSGHTVLGADVLQSAVADAMGKPHDLAGLRNLAKRISELYRKQGYPFARAFLPPQALDDGRLRIEIVEGRYGKVQSIGDDVAFAARAQGWLSALRPGDVIETSALERTTLLLDDLPGILTIPIIRPGEQVGTGDLDVQVSRGQRMQAALAYDNQGNRYTGYHRLRADLSLNSALWLGDQLSLNLLGSNELLWLGAFNYSVPLGYSGLKASAGYSRTSYEIGRELISSDTEGIAEVLTAGLSYPLLRSQKANITLSGALQHKRLEDRNGLGVDRKSSDTLPLSLQFDHRDSLGGGGITYGSISWTAGRLKRDAISDSLNTGGSFQKFNLDVVRVQSLVRNLALYARASVQQASKNLDSSEGMSLGGAGAVRAYPVGELSGDEGWLAQLELRYNLGVYAPYAFYDQGNIQTNVSDSFLVRVLAGYGVGLRYQRNAWSADMALAWRSKGGRPVDANERDAKPRIWVNAHYRF